MKKDFTFYSVISLIGLVIIGLSLVSEIDTFLPEPAMAATSSAVTVSAEVVSSIACDRSPAATDFLTLSTGVVATSTPNASTTMSCANSAGGCTLYVKDDGSPSNPGLWNSSASSLIESPDAAYNATATLSGSAEGYGIQGATTTVGSGAVLGLATRYLQIGNTVGGLATSTLVGLTLASSTSQTTNREVLITHKAVIINTTPAGSYADIITYSCLDNY